MPILPDRLNLGTWFSDIATLASSSSKDNGSNKESGSSPAVEESGEKNRF